MDEDELFNPDYVEVDRVIDMKTSTDSTTGEETALYLVKWRSLPYDECTWELAQDIDTEKIEAFFRVKDPPPENDRKVQNCFFSFFCTSLNNFMLVHDTGIDIKNSLAVCLSIRPSHLILTQN